MDVGATVEFTDQVLERGIALLPSKSEPYKVTCRVPSSMLLEKLDIVPFHEPLKYTVEFQFEDWPVKLNSRREVPFMVESIEVAAMVEVGVIEFVP
tara:strand:- start:252 stop:539 length:288 start_codon:yes stop_codon:yes gene_type:complete